MTTAAPPLGVSVLVPVAGPPPDLDTLHAELVEQLDALDVRYEVLYLVGRQRPLASESLRKLRARDPDRTRVLEVSASAGAWLLVAGAQSARGSVLVTVPGYPETDLRVLPELLAALHRGADVAIACRRRGRSGFATASSVLFNRIFSWIVATRFRDIASATRALRAAVLDETPLYGDFDRYLPWLAQRQGFRVVEIDASPHPRARRSPRHAARTYLWRAIDLLTIFFLGRFTRYPLRLFGGVGFAAGASGLLVLGVAGAQRLAGTPLANRPVLVLGTLLLGLGAQAFAIGLLGELLLFLHARSLRDYRVASVHEAKPPPLSPREREDTSLATAVAGPIHVAERDPPGAKDD